MRRAQRWILVNSRSCSLTRSVSQEEFGLRQVSIAQKQRLIVRFNDSYLYSETLTSLLVVLFFLMWLALACRGWWLVILSNHECKPNECDIVKWDSMEWQSGSPMCFGPELPAAQQTPIAFQVTLIAPTSDGPFFRQLAASVFRSPCHMVNWTICEAIHGAVSRRPSFLLRCRPFPLQTGLLFTVCLCHFCLPTPCTIVQLRLFIK